MIKNLSIILFLILLSSSVYASTNGELLKALNKVFGPLNSSVQLEERLARGKWNKTNNAFAIAERVDDAVYKYVFLVKDQNNILPIKIGVMKDSDGFPKTGKRIAYYDRYVVESNIDGDVNTGDLMVSYTYRAWKDSQRYTVRVKPIGIDADGSLDWSHY